MDSADLAWSLTRPFSDLRFFLDYLRRRGFAPGLLLDVGAHRGDWTRLAREIFPAARVLMVEPLPEMREPLAATCRDLAGVECVEAALGAARDEGVLTLYDDLQATTLLSPVSAEWLASGRQRPIALRTLDELLGERGLPPPELVKLDVQGFELEVLKGATSLFGVTELFILEASLYRFYPELPLVSEVVAFMARRGYDLFDVAGTIRRPSDGALAQLDLAFARRSGSLRRHDRW